MISQRTCPSTSCPCSNEEFLPPPPNRAQLTIRALAEQETERMRRKFNMSRRQFVRTAAASAIGFWAIDMVMPGRFGNYGWADNTATTDACDLEWDGRKGMATLRNLPGEFIFDVQTHHVDPEGQWLVSSPLVQRLLFGGLAAGARGWREHPLGQPLAAPLPQGALPRLGDDVFRAFLRADVTGHRQPAAACGGLADRRDGQRAGPLEAGGDARLRDAEPRPRNRGPASQQAARCSTRSST